MLAWLIRLILAAALIAAPEAAASAMPAHARTAAIVGMPMAPCAPSSGVNDALRCAQCVAALPAPAPDIAAAESFAQLDNFLDRVIGPATKAEVDTPPPR